MTILPTITLGICSDTHGEQLPHWPGHKIHAVLHGGDVYHAPTLAHGDNYANPRAWAAAQSVPVLAVRGNHDYRDPDGFLDLAEDISGRLYRIAAGLWVAGVGFAPEWYCDTPGERDLEPQCRDLIRMASRQVMPGERIILLTHYPPRLPELPCDEASAGCAYGCVADLMETLGPIAVVFGHKHDWFGLRWRRAAGTLLVSPGPLGGVLTIRANSEVVFEAGTAFNDDKNSVDSAESTR
jgi:Icc-related predicted phosphoesterase